MLGAIITLAALAFVCWYVWKAIFGKCPYCGSRDIVPDDGAFFYCNDCHKKS